MTAARLPGGNAGLVGSALIAAFGIFIMGPACSPSGGPATPEVSAVVGAGGRPPGLGGSGSLGGSASGPSGGGAAPQGGAGPQGGAPPIGGAGPGAGGFLPMGGTSGAPQAGQPPVGGMCNVQVVDPSPLPPCTTCMGGRCVNPADYPTAPASQLAKCGDGSQICLPDPLVATKGNIALPRCTSVASAEGRCTSLCIPVAASLSGVLPQDSCAPTDRCAPCYNPVDGTSTGVCTIGCDPGPTQPAVVFTQCCSGRGRCVPRAAIPDGPAKSNLAKETCTGSSDPVCVPTAIIQDPTYKFPTCTSQLFVDPGKPGVCVPKCIVDANPAGAALAQDDCANTTDKCVPCTNPSTGQPSGACDAP